ncbi:MAG: hypothetical protein ABIJ34_04610 [archaeon]
MDIGVYCQMKLTDLDKKELINKLEKRSLYFLQFFSVFWFTLFFFIIREFDNNMVTTQIFQNFGNTISANGLIGLLTNMPLLILFIVIPYVLISLSKNSVSNLLDTHFSKNISEDELMVEKNRILKNALKWGFISSILLILYLVYLYFMFLLRI